MISSTPISQTDDSLDSFLVEPQSLLAAFTNLDGLIIDARSPEAYAAGHIPGAVSVSTYDYFVPNTKPEGMHAFASQAAALYGAAGISLDTPSWSMTTIPGCALLGSAGYWNTSGIVMCVYCMAV
jgi:3-mercaptopyruvate sulfurtransferase SseA